MTQKTIYISGMHCASCEILIRQLFRDYAGVELVDITPQGKTTISYTDDSVLDGLAKAITELGYTMHLDSPGETGIKNRKEVIILLVFGIGVRLFFSELDFSQLSLLIPQQGDSYSLRGIFVLGLIASISTCLALVGTFVMTWGSLQGEGKENFWKAIRHQLQFHGGRILGFAVGGALLGSLGGVFIFSPQINGRISIIVAVLMIFIGWNMVGRFRLGGKENPKLRDLKEKFIFKLKLLSQKSRGGPVVGALTFFLPCGFTQLAQLTAIQSGSPAQGLLTMGVFALGTLPMLLIMGMTGNRLHSGHLGIRYKLLGVFIVVVSVFLIIQSLRLLGISF